MFVEHYIRAMKFNLLFRQTARAENLRKPKFFDTVWRTQILALFRRISTLVLFLTKMVTITKTNKYSQPIGCWNDPSSQNKRIIKRTPLNICCPNHSIPTKNKWEVKFNIFPQLKFTSHKYLISLLHSLLKINELRDP